MMEIKLTLKPLAFAVHRSKTLPRHEEITKKMPMIHASSPEHPVRPDRDSLARMSLSALLYYALIGDHATAN
jgi:hypothetical protein